MLKLEDQIQQLKLPLQLEPQPVPECGRSKLHCWNATIHLKQELIVCNTILAKVEGCSPSIRKRVWSRTKITEFASGKKKVLSKSFAMIVLEFCNWFLILGHCSMQVSETNPGSTSPDSFQLDNAIASAHGSVSNFELVTLWYLALCENIMIFLSIRFYVKTILGII